MERSEIQKRRDGIIQRIVNAPVATMHVAMLSRDKEDLLANVRCMIQEDPEAAKEVLQAAIEVLAAGLLLNAAPAK